MKNRTNKRRIYALYQSRSVRRTDEEQAWLDVIPVGREFGSPDYERLLELDNLSDAAKAAADQAYASIDQARPYVAESNNRILDMEKKK